MHSPLGVMCIYQASTLACVITYTYTMVKPYIKGANKCIFMHFKAYTNTQIIGKILSCMVFQYLIE